MTHSDLESISRILHLKRLSEQSGHSAGMLSVVLKRATPIASYLDRDIRRSLRNASLVMLSDPATYVENQWTFDDLKKAKYFFNVEAFCRLLNRRATVVSRWFNSPFPIQREGVREAINEVLNKHNLMLIHNPSTAEESPENHEVRSLMEEWEQSGVKLTRGDVMAVAKRSPNRQDLLELAAMCLYVYRNTE